MLLPDPSPYNNNNVVVPKTPAKISINVGFNIIGPRNKSYQSRGLLRFMLYSFRQVVKKKKKEPN